MKRKNVLKVLSLPLTALMLVSGWQIYSALSIQQKAKEEFADLAALVAPPVSKPTTTALLEENAPSQESTEPTEVLRDLTELFAQNEECIGWLSIPETEIDYPVMHTPNEPQKYLYRSFYGEYSPNGVPFLDFRCDETSNLIIYGHHMRSGAMFAPLINYTDEDFCVEHPVIELQTAAGLSRYTVFAVAEVQKTDAWYKFIRATSRMEFDEQIAALLDKANYPTGVSPAYGQQLLTLSTCYGGEDGRLIIAAVKT